MGHKIGFIKDNEEVRKVKLNHKEPKRDVKVRKSVASVYFADKDVTFAYYNDQFDLKPGDWVYVEGKLEGVLGRVREVNYTFKIKLSDYKRVIAVVDTDVKGDFYTAGSHFVTFDRKALPKEQAALWFRAPLQEEEYESGYDDTSFSLDQLSEMNIAAHIAERGHEYYSKSKVRYLCVDGNKGYALVEGREAYEVEFEYHERQISNLVCQCFCSYPCKIVDYWKRHQDECGLSVDWSEAHERCWRCGCKKNLERAHIIPDPLGGKDEPSNLVLLCKRCHADGPNVDDPEIMWDWIRAYGVPLYDTFWSIMGRKEYQFIYGHSLEEELKNIFTYATPNVSKEQFEDMVKDKFANVKEKCSIHFGQPYFNTATVAGMYRMVVKDIAKDLGVEFPMKEDREKRRPWWLGVIG